jgi:hypothetical protein
MAKHRGKPPEFLSQIPDWESTYKTSEDPQIDFERHEWKSAQTRSAGRPA